MAYPTLVNGQITDAVTQQSVQVLAAAPAMAMSSVYQSAAHSLGILYQNAVQAQRESAICAQASTNQGVIQLYALNAATAAVATAKQANSNRASELLTLLLLAKALK
jgi:hypothetical protein